MGSTWIRVLTLPQGHTKLPDYHEVAGYPPNPWWNLVSPLGRDGQNLCRELLKFDPMARVSAKAALHHKFFTTGERPTAPILLPKPLAELRPRDIAPQDVAGMPDSGTKRKNTTPNGTEQRSIARKLFA